MKNNFRKAAATTICMLMVAVMSLTGVTYAWFTAGTQATVNGMNVQVTAADGGVQVRLEGSSTWQTTLGLGVEAKNVAPVSSADGVNFFTVGEYNPANNAQAKVESVTKADNANIIVKKVELSNPGQQGIVVDLDGSSIVAATGDGVVDNEIYKAARVALIVSGGSYDEAVTYIYTPEADSWNGFVATSANYVDLNTAIENIAVAKTSNLYDACRIELDANPDNADASKIVDVEIVIWLEGQDSDCKNANAKGAFDIVLNFKDVNA